MESDKDLTSRYKLDLDAEMMNDDVSRDISSLIRESSKEVQEDESDAYTSLKPTPDLGGKQSQQSMADSLRFAPNKNASKLIKIEENKEAQKQQTVVPEQDRKSQKNSRLERNETPLRLSPRNYPWT